VSPARPFDDPRRPTRRPVSRIGELLPEAARELGITEQLRWALAGAAWEEVVGERVPGAAGGSRPVRVEGHGTLVVEAASAVIGQELRIRAEELLEAFGERQGGIRAERLRVVVGRGMIRSP
jgi:predicted nucleic acid-binding Zn ribbon protein